MKISYKRICFLVKIFSHTYQNVFAQQNNLNAKVMYIIMYCILSLSTTIEIELFYPDFLKHSAVLFYLEFLQLNKCNTYYLLV